MELKTMHKMLYIPLGLTSQRLVGVLCRQKRTSQNYERNYLKCKQCISRNEFGANVVIFRLSRWESLCLNENCRQMSSSSSNHNAATIKVNSTLILSGKHKLAKLDGVQKECTMRCRKTWSHSNCSSQLHATLLV